jgi:hypothetical protein
MLDKNEQTLTNIDPYPGLASFADLPEHRRLFFGREKETQALLEMILAENLVLLFARSGVGKTSLVNAGILEPLRTKGFFPIVVRLTHDSDRGPIQSVFECIAEQAKRDGVTVGDTATPRSLWEYFYATQFLKEGRLLRPVLVLDQFEELFTIIGPQKSRRESFVTELADLARQRVPERVRKRETGNLEKLDQKLERLEVEPDVSGERQRLVSLLYEGGSPEIKIVICLREDFLAELEGLKGELPTIFRNSLRVEPLSIDDARAAIQKPTEQKELLGENQFTFAPGVVDRMLDFLRLQKIAGKYVRANSVEPVQLQILCQHFYRQSMKKGARQPTGAAGKQNLTRIIPEITLTDLGGRNGMKRAMVGYYYRVLKEFPRFRFGWSPRRYRPSLCNFLIVNRARAAIRLLSENKLVTPGGYRNSISVDVIKRGVGVPEDDLTKLVDERLLRTEPRLGSHFYELTHDTLLRPLVEARKKRKVYWAASVLLPLLLLVYVPGLVISAGRYLEIWPLKATVSNLDADPKNRIEAFKRLLTTPRYRDCSKCDLSVHQNDPPIDLHSFTAYGAGLSEAKLMRVNLSGATCAMSDFSHANLSEANLEKANLMASDLTGANLTKTNLRKANLRNVDFTNSILTGADFEWAQLDGADMRTARLDPKAFQSKEKDGTVFTGTMWWMAIWPTSLIQTLRESNPPETIIHNSQYKEQLRELDSFVQSYYLANYNYADDPEMAEAAAASLNNRAWFYATSGALSEFDKAEKDAREARRIKPGLDRAMDTLGYILLIRGRFDEALAELRLSLASRENGASDPIRVGLAHYHLGLVLDRKGDSQEAEVEFQKAKEIGYRPTYECVLTPPSNMAGCDWPPPWKDFH